LCTLGGSSIVAPSTGRPAGVAVSRGVTTVSRALSRRSFLVGGLAVGTTLTVGGAQAWATEPPPFVDCAGWGARPPSAPVPVWRQRPVKILVHHTASPNVRNLSRGAADALARSIQNFHMDRRGWIDSGQHLTISRGGHVLEGRHRTLEAMQNGEHQVEGAHCTGQNVVAVGIENEGTYSKGEPPTALWNRLRETCAYICARYGIAPSEIYGHRDFKNTACPGDGLYGLLPRLREQVGGLLGRRVEGRADKASWPLLRPGDSGEEVLAAQYLLRSVGQPDLQPTGTFDVDTDRAVRELQARHGAEEVNGLLGAESWPVLTAMANRLWTPGAAGPADAERAVALLAEMRDTEAAPGRLDRLTWQRLLGSTGAPVDQRTDPPGAGAR
jgi:N-acetyl-anhydromuramyl-L-alanine amidase AmpD